MKPLSALLFERSVLAAARKTRKIAVPAAGRCLAIAGLVLGLTASIGLTWAADGDVRAQFNLVDPAIGPFPADQFTVPDSSQITGLRVALPKPDCSKQPTDCDDISVLNTLDGFNPQPRIAVSFDGQINPSSVTSKSVAVVAFGTSSPPRLIAINQVVWDPATKALYFTSDELLGQHAQFALIVTNGILDALAKPVQASEDFARYLSAGSGEYRDRLRAGLDAAVSLGIARESIVTASVFTTMSASAILEKIREQIHAAVPEPASFTANGVRTVFERSAISSITVRRQTRISPPGFTDATPFLSGLDLVPGSAGTVAFGTFSSPNYLTPQQVIPAVGSLIGNPTVQGKNTLSFNLIVPSGTQPAKGWPVAIYGHYNNGSKEDIYLFASILAKHGIATIAINTPGHGFGALGTLDIKLNGGETVTISAGGRGVDMNGDNAVGFNEGLSTIGSPFAVIRGRDTWRQTVVDLMQLVRVIQVGMDLNGDGRVDLDASRLYYLGSSFGANYGIPFLAVEPAIRAGAVAFAGGPRADSLRLGGSRNTQGTYLRDRNPSLINSPGVTRIGGLAIAAPFFNENKPLRNLPPVINDVAGAIEIQRVFDYQNWITLAIDPATFAPYLRKRPLPGMTAKPVLLLFAKGDQTTPVTGATAIIRAGELADVTTYFRFDIAYAKDPRIPSRNPHIINTGIAAANGETVVAIATGMQEQAATFLASDGARIIHPTPTEFFEVPIKLPLPENIEYVTAAPQAQHPVDAAVFQTGLSPGSLFTIFGQTNSVSEARSAGPGNLPTTLGGVTVSVNGRPAPLLYVGPNQINGQIPYETAAAATSQVIANGISAAQVPFTVAPVAPRIFSDKENMCVAQNHDGTANSMSNRAQAGRYIGAYLTGIGAVAPAVPSGAPARGDVYSIPPGTVSASIGRRTVIPTFLGLVPGLVGVAEADLLLPSDMASGVHGLSIAFGNTTSNVCQIAIGQ